MKFLRLKSLNILIMIVSVLAVIAVIIGIRVSITMVNRHNQMLEKLPSEQNVAVQGVSKPVSVGALKDTTFYFNGESLGVFAYLTNKNEVYFPFDTLQQKMGNKFTYYSSDDIVESMVNGIKLLMTIGNNNVRYGNQEINMQSIPVTGKNHILAPSELFAKFEGFKLNHLQERDTVFLDYWPGFRKNYAKNIKVLTIDNKMLQILDLAGNLVRDFKSILKSSEKILASPDHSKFIAIYENKVFLGTKDQRDVLLPIPVDASATWSAESDYLYWIDHSKKTSFVYDIANKRVEELGDYYFEAITGGEDGLEKYNGNMLYVYRKGPDFKRIVLTNGTYDTKFIFIERNGKVVVKGEFEYSPDKTRILYRKSDNYYYLSNLKGTNQFCLGHCDVARWVDNDKIFIRDGEKSLVYSRSEKKKTEVGEDWYRVGQSENGDVFFMRGDTLYCESDWVEKKVMMISGGCDYVDALSGKGPYIIASQKEDNILFLNDDTIRYLGKFSSLVESSKDGEITTDFGNNVLISPDKKTLVIVQKNKDFISMNALNSNGTNFRNITLSYSLNESTDIYKLNPLWLSNDQLMIYSDKKVWVIGLNGPTKIYEWDYAEDKQIQGILRD